MINRVNAIIISIYNKSFYKFLDIDKFILFLNKIKKKIDTKILFNIKWWNFCRTWFKKIILSNKLANLLGIKLLKLKSYKIS